MLGYLQQTAPQMVEKHVAHLRAHGMASSYNPAPVGVAACPSVQVRAWDDGRPTTDDRRQAAAIPLFGWGQESEAAAPRQQSELRQWPVQLHLVPIQAPFFQDADLALIADCVPFASPNTHADFIKDHAIAVGCPKLDDGRAYIAKLAQILSKNDIRSVTVVRMEVPCCGGLEFIAVPGSRSERQRHPSGERDRQRRQLIGSRYPADSHRRYWCACSPRPARDEESFFGPVRNQAAIDAQTNLRYSPREKVVE